jgi:hypothetical protein
MHLYTTVSVIPNKNECGNGMKAAPTAALRNQIGTKQKERKVGQDRGRM